MSLDHAFYSFNEQTWSSSIRIPQKFGRNNGLQNLHKYYAGNVIEGNGGCGRDGIEGNGGNAGLGRFGNCRRLRAASPPKNDKAMKRDKIRHLKAAMLVMFQGLTRLYIIIYKQKEDWRKLWVTIYDFSLG